MPDFTPEQHEAAEFRGSDACIVAGPGSGKTTVLVERYRRLIVEHRLDPRQILAITFTEKAAANMKAKLAAQFQHDAVRLRDLESAWVSTIHGFCARLLRENAIAAGLDPRFSVLGPREAESLQWECINGALDHLTAHRRDETLELIEALHVPVLAWDLKDAYDAMRSAGMTTTEIRNKPAAPAPHDLAGELRQLLNGWPASLTQTRRFELARLRSWCEEYDAAARLDSDAPPLRPDAAERFGSDVPTGFGSEPRQQGSDLDFTSFLALMDRLAINLGRVPPEAKEGLEEFRQTKVAAARSAAVDRHAARFRSLIFDVLDRFDEDYRNRKAQSGRVDFNDLERHAITLLKEHPEVRRRVHTQFRQIMLDEFQDINGQQAELIALLRAPDTFFAVGDINQLIYGFRYAKPEIFRKYHQEVTFKAGQSVALLDNFRSREAILSCVRETLAAREGIEDRALISGKIFAGKDAPSIEVLKVLDSEPDREASWIAHRIQELRGTLHLGKPGETRTADYRDFAVLCRNSESMPPILVAFERAGIPYVCGRRQSFLLSREGLDITALLSVIANPRDSISLATVLRGPLAGVSDEGLIHLRLLASGLTEGLNKFAHTAAGVAQSDAGKLTRFVTNLNRWRQDQPIVPLDILLARALADCGQSWTPNTLAGMNIESFLQLARTTGSVMDLPAFLLEVEGLANAVGTESDLSDEDQGNCVQVMTAHASKGLEFPVTIIAGMERGTRRETRAVTFTEEHGLGLKWRNPKKDAKELKDSWSEANKLALRAREEEEENRLLYVAMTRAEEHLILSYTAGRGKPQNWAGLIENRLNISQLSQSSEPQHQQRAGYSVSILITDSDPPLTHYGPSNRDNELLIIDRPVITIQHESTVTVTALALFGNCPRKYYIQRSLGWNSGRFRRFDPQGITDVDEGDDDFSASEIGSTVHEILAGIEPKLNAPEARQLAEKFLKSTHGARAAASAKTGREWAFIAEIDGVIVRGSIDLWFEENGEIHLVDYKTDDVTVGDASVRARDYAPQLALYAFALERAFGRRPKSAWLHFLRPDGIVEIPVDEPAIADARRLIAGLREAQDGLKFDLNEGEHCRSCQFYRSLCPAGQSSPIPATSGQEDAILDIA